MKQTLALLIIIAVCISCGAPSQTATFYSEISTPQETGLDLRCLTDDNISVIATSISMTRDGNSIASWERSRRLALSPDGTQLVHISKINGEDVAVVRNISYPQVGTQRTFLNTQGICWGVDNKLYYGSYISSHRSICTVSALSGTLMRQLTSASDDRTPALTRDGKKLFFTRFVNNAYSIWCYNLEDSSLTMCCSGSNPYPIDDKGKTLLCERNNSIWLVDYEKGQESLILSSTTHSFDKPSLSPTGEYILVEGTSLSSISNKKNLDIFVVKIDGTGLTQLTFHPEHDLDPVWSADGKRIYFISSRGNNTRKYNIWSMKFPYAN